MSCYIADASVAIKWFVPEVHELAALRLLEQRTELHVPDLIYAEIGNILWKKWYRGEIDKEDVFYLIDDFKAVRLTVHKTEELMENAWKIARQYKRSFYDSLYVALAVKTDCRMVTADLKLYNALKITALKKHVLWIQDIPS